MPHTLVAGDEQARLMTALTNMAESDPPHLFANRYFLTTDIVKGGQSVVVFARGRVSNMHHIAIKCASWEAVAALSVIVGDYQKLHD
jgi:hypothetical protein